MEPRASKNVSLIQIAVKYKKNVIFGFHFIYIIILGIAAYSIYSAIYQIRIAEVYGIGINSGIFALCFFCLTLIPGITRRFKLRLEFVQVLMLFRRQIGVSTFLFGFLHYGALRLFPILFAGVPLNTSPPIFEIFGVLSLYPMTLLFLTSNDFSVRKLGKWWTILHSLSYIIVWTIFFHVAFQRPSIWSILIGVFAVSEAGSLIYNLVRGRKKELQS